MLEAKKNEKKNALTPKHAAATIISGKLCMYINLALSGCRENQIDRKGTIQILEIMSAPDLGFSSGKQQHIIQGERKWKNWKTAMDKYGKPLEKT